MQGAWLPPRLGMAPEILCVWPTPSSKGGTCRLILGSRTGPPQVAGGSGGTPCSDLFCGPDLRAEPLSLPRGTGHLSSPHVVSPSAAIVTLQPHFTDQETEA